MTLFSLDSGPRLYIIILTATMGAVMGSFLNCAAYRLSHGEKISKGRSRCPSCGHTLGVPDLFPVLSWVLLRGKCRFCSARISVRYPLTELFLAAMFLLCLFQDGLYPILFRDLIFGCCLFTLSLVDLDTYEIPDRFHVIAIAAWFLYLPFSDERVCYLKEGLLGAFLIAGSILMISLIMDRVLKKESLGGGDVKLLFVTGLYIGLFGSLFLLIIACVIGLLTVVIFKHNKIPFGPSISASAWIMLMVGHRLVDWYLSLF